MTEAFRFSLQLLFALPLACGDGASRSGDVLDSSSSHNGGSSSGSQSNVSSSGASPSSSSPGSVPTPFALTHGEDTPLGIAVDATSVYWTNWQGEVRKVPVGGGTPITLASGQSPGFEIAVDDANVYWINGSNPPSSTVKYPATMPPVTTGGVPTLKVLFNTVMKVPLAGGAPVALASSQNSRGALAVSATSAYWITTNYPMPDSLVKVSLAGGAVIPLASGRLGGIAVDATGVYWLNPNVMKLPEGGGTPVVIGDAQCHAPMAIDTMNVYCTQDVGILKVPLGGGTTTLLSGGSAMAVDGTSVYWASEGSDYPVAITPTAMKVSAVGGAAPIRLAYLQFGVKHSIAVDATSVYWTDTIRGYVGDLRSGGGVVMKLTPK